MAYIDEYLISELAMAEGGQPRRLGRRDTEAVETRTLPRVPMIIRVKNPDWRPKAKDYEERFRIGTLVACTGTRRTLDAFRLDPDVVAVESSKVVEGLDCSASVPAVRGDTVQRPPTSETGDMSIVGIVDCGIDIEHEAFLDGAGKSRILAIWDQRCGSGTPPKNFRFGTLYKADEINRFLSNRSLIPSQLKRNNGHGTHVASIAAGLKTGAFSGGMAPGARVVVVIPDLQTRPPDPNSIGYSQSHLAALKFIKNFAEQEALPAVVNVSLGMNAGAHDGRSLLESGFDAIVQNGREPGFIIVKSAGNERGWDGHASLALKAGASDAIEWRSKSVPRVEDYIEVWFSSCDEFEFRLVSPDGSASGRVDKNHCHDKGVFPGTGNYFELALSRYHYDNGDSRLLVRVRKQSSKGVAPGTWRLEVTAGKVKSSGLLHAWIERDSARAAAFSTHGDDGMTLSIPGTSISTITVAASDRLGNGIASFSSFGPTRDGRRKPDVCAPGEQIQAAKAAAGSGTVAMSGTSMAAPHVTGAIALLLSRREKQRRKDPTLQQLNAAQIQAALAHTAKGFNGSWRESSGFGLMDTEGLLATFG